jgi:carbon storage regulator
MLVLSRKIGQAIQIGDEVRITILDVRRGVVRLGVEAPREISVVRSELIEKEPARAGVPEAA